MSGNLPRLDRRDGGANRLACPASGRPDRRFGQQACLETGIVAGSGGGISQVWAEVFAPEGGCWQRGSPGLVSDLSVVMLTIEVIQMDCSQGSARDVKGQNRAGGDSP